MLEWLRYPPMFYRPRFFLPVILAYTAGLIGYMLYKGASAPFALAAGALITMACLVVYRYIRPSVHRACNRR